VTYDEDKKIADYHISGFKNIDLSGLKKSEIGENSILIFNQNSKISSDLDFVFIDLDKKEGKESNIVLGLY